MLPVDLHGRCVGKRPTSGKSLVPASIQDAPYVIWSDSTLAAKLNELPSVRESPEPTKVPDYLEPVKLHKIRANMAHCGGVLADMPKWVEKLVPATVANCVFVGVCSFNDFFAKPSANKPTAVMYHLPDEFFNNLDRFIDRLNELFAKSVMICCGSSRTWGEKDTVFDIHAARVRERLRQGGILVVNPIGLFDALPKREGDPWHFLCLIRNDRDYVTNGHDSTLLSLETLISHVVLIANHLIESKEVVRTRGKTWLADMKPKSAT